MTVHIKFRTTDDHKQKWQSVELNLMVGYDTPVSTNSDVFGTTTILDITFFGDTLDAAKEECNKYVIGLRDVNAPFATHVLDKITNQLEEI